MPWKSIGVTMTEDELERLDALAKRLKVSRNSIMRFFVLWGLAQAESGDLDLRKHIKTERKLTPPE